MTALYRSLILGFYRRNALLLTLVLIFMVFVFRPPTMLVSPYFVEPMLEDIRFFLGVIAVLGLYQAKAWRESVQAFSRPGNQFLLALGGLAPRTLRWELLKVSLGILAPTWSYILVIMGYSFYHGTWHGWALLTMQVGTLWGMSSHMIHRVLHPSERALTSHRSPWNWQLNLVYPLWQGLWTSQSRSVIIHKIGAAALLIGIARYHVHEPFSDKGMGMVLLSVATLQAMLPFWLRRHTDDWLMPWRNLPLSVGRWWSSYLLLGGLLFLPEALIAIAWEMPLWAVGSYWLGATALFMLAIALLHYQSLTVERYLIRSGSAYVVAFVILLYGFPWWGLAWVALGLGSWIFAEEFRKWNGFG